MQTDTAHETSKTRVHVVRASKRYLKAKILIRGQEAATTSKFTWAEFWKILKSFRQMIL